jgi:PAS domain S-box-containing protein
MTTFKPNQQNPSKWHLLENLLIATIYFIVAKLSLMLQFESSNATPVWPPSGFAFAMILLFGYRVCPGIMVGAFAVNLLIFSNNHTSQFPESLILSLVIAIGNTGESIAGCMLMQKFLRKSFSRNFFSRVNQIFVFSLVALVMCLVSCTLGTSTNFFAGIIKPGQYFIVWLTWWLGDVSGILLATPFIIILIDSLKTSSPLLKTGWKKLAEAASFFLLTILASGVVFDNWFVDFFIFQWAFWMIPVLTWAAVRFGQRETVTGLMICSVIAIWGTINHHGPFSVGPLNQSLLTVQAFISIVSITQLALNLSIIERKRTAATLMKTRNELEKKVQERTAELQNAANQLAEQKSFAELLIESSPDMLIAYDVNLAITAWNKKTSEHTGVIKEDALGKHIFELFPEYDTEKWRNLLNDVLTGQSLHYPKIRFEQGFGWGDAFFVPLRNAKSEVIGLLSITRNITNVVQMANAVEQKNQQLERINYELASFSYIASHDLQEPLRKIRTFAKRILETESEVLSETGKDYFRRMQNAAERMQRLIEDLLAYSRTNTSEEYFEKTDLNVLLANVKNELGEKITEASAIIESGELPILNVIPFQFQQLFTNLITNSLKFANPEIPLVICITSDLVTSKEVPGGDMSAGNKYHQLKISDNGIGFEPQYNEQIFQLFQRLHSRRDYEGTGIGLAICKKIVDNHQGVITAHGEPGKGATFLIYLPAE